MASQLFGVLRDVVASETGTTTSASSELFTPELKSSTDRPDWRALPALLVSTDDPSAGFLASLPAANVDDVDEAIVLLAGAPEPSVEVQLRHARLLLDAGRTDDADDVLAPVAASDRREWRVAWYRGLARLQEGDAAAALPAFETVYHAVPGELAPKLALGCAHESAEDFGAAAHWYDVVSRTDAAFTLASFGLARCRLASGDVAGAVRAYERVPERSSAFLAAQVAKAEAMLDVAASHSRQDLTDAAVVVDRLQDGSEEHTRLSVRLLEVALEVVRRDGDDPAAKSVLGCAYTETSIRFGLEEAYRTLARFTSSASKRIALIDRANAARPRTLV
jgi:serine/threonine-protein kinase PknG